jgi:hypothetical protein
MESIPIPKTLEIYLLLKQDKMYFNPAGAGSTGSLGFGFFLSEKGAEHHRTMEILREPDAKFYIFSLTVDNPAYKKIL